MWSEEVAINLTYSCGSRRPSRRGGRRQALKKEEQELASLMSKGLGALFGHFGSMRQRLNAPDVWANSSPQSLTDPEAKGWGDCRQGGFSGDPLENLCREGWALEMCKVDVLSGWNIRDLVNGAGSQV